MKRCAIAVVGLFACVGLAMSDEISTDWVRYYQDQIGRSTSYEDLQRVEMEIFAKDGKLKDLDADQKAIISQTVVDQWSHNVDVECGLGMAEETLRFIFAFSAGVVGNLPVVPGAIGGALDAWGSGVQNHKSATRILQDMMAGAVVGGVVPKLFGSIGKVASKLAKSKFGRLLFSEIKNLSRNMTIPESLKAAENLCKKIISESQGEIDVLVDKVEEMSVLRKNYRAEIKQLKKQYGDLLRKPDASLSVDDLALKNQVKNQLSKLDSLLRGTENAIEVAKREIKTGYEDVGKLIKEAESLARELSDEMSRIDKEVIPLATKDITQFGSFLTSLGSMQVYSKTIADQIEKQIDSWLTDETTEDSDTTVLYGSISKTEYKTTTDQSDSTITGIDATPHSPDQQKQTGTKSSGDQGPSEETTQTVPSTHSQGSSQGGGPKIESDMGKTTTTDGQTTQTHTASTPTTTTTSTGDNNSSTDQSGVAEWRKIAYEVLTGKEFPDGDNTSPTTTDGQNTDNSSGDGNSGNDKGQNGPNGGNEQNTSNSDTNGSGSDGQNNNVENKNGQNGNGQNIGSNADGKNDKGKITDNGISDAGTTTENGGTGEIGKSSDKNVPKNPIVATTQDDFVNMGMSNGGNDGNSGLDALAQQMLKEYLTGESQVLSPDFIPGAFGSLSSDPQKAETIANEAFGHAVDSVVSDGAVSQAIKDFMSQGGDVQQTLSSFLDGKVTEDQKSQILTLSDALGKVGEDGGKSLINALGDQGAQLADSLVINEIKNQLLSSLPKDQAEQLNAIIGTLDAKGLSAETKQKIAGVIQDLVSKTLPNYSAETINGLIQDIVDGNSIDKLDTVKVLGKSITADALKAVLKNNLDPKLAGKINSLIDGYMKNGTQGLSEAALKELNALIDQYAPGANTAKLLKDTVNGIVFGTANPADWKDVATSVVSDAANKLIDESNLPQDVKDAAKAAVNGLAQNGLTGLTTNMRDFISDYVSDKLGSDEAGEAVGKIFDAVVTPGVDPWQEIVKQAPVIGMALAEKCLAEAEKLAAQQIDKLIAKYPNVKKVLDKLGINGAGIVQGVVNVLGVLLAAPNLSTAITQLSAMAVNFLKNIAAKLIDWALEWAVSWLNNTLMPKVLTWASNTLEKWADSVDNDLIKKGLEYLKQQCENCKKQGGIKIKTAGTGKKVVDYVDDLIKKRKKSQSGTTVLKSK